MLRVLVNAWAAIQKQLDSDLLTPSSSFRPFPANLQIFTNAKKNHSFQRQCQAKYFKSRRFVMIQNNNFPRAGNDDPMLAYCWFTIYDVGLLMS